MVDWVQPAACHRDAITTSSSSLVLFPIFSPDFERVLDEGNIFHYSRL
jgi:hypothetical protein